MEKRKERSITLTLTASCNLSCSYCYEHSKCNKMMSFETAKKIIDAEFQKNDDSDLYIELFGGEPFLAFELIKQIYDYVEEKYKNRRWLFFTTTNGTLVHGEIQDWLKSHKHIVVGLSLDGTKEMHDLNRSNSFDKIDLDFFLKTYPIQHVKMTISQETLPQLAEGVIFAHKKGFKVSCNLAFGIDWSNENNVAVLERELKKLIEYYLNNPQIEPCSMLSFPIHNVCNFRKMPKLHKWCGTGTEMKAYDTDGTSYPCQFFLPLSAGEEKAKLANSINFEKEYSYDNVDEKCKNCKIVEACPTCYGSNFVAFGDIYKKDDNLCKLTKIIIKARSYFKAMQWSKNQLSLDENIERDLLESILIIQDNF